MPGIQSAGRRVPTVGEGGPRGSAHSQLVDEDVGHPDALHGEGDLRQVVEPLRVPPEELVRPVLGDKGEGAQRARSLPAGQHPNPTLAPCHGNQSSGPPMGGRKGSSSSYRTARMCDTGSTKAVPWLSCPTEVLSFPGMGSTLLHSCRATCLTRGKTCVCVGARPQRGRAEGARSHLLTCLYQT